MPSLSSLTQKLGTQLNTKRSTLTLIEVDDSQRPVSSDGKINALSLQYFPESLSDNKTINNTTKEIPGASLPLYQWVASGERTISFTAVFTTDMDLTEIRGPADIVTSSSTGKYNPDIRSAITWLRQFELPQYSNGGSGSNSSIFTRAPSRLKLIIPNSGIGLYGGDDGIFRHPDTVLVIMTQCDVTIETMFPSGLPRIATVSLAFAQTGQYQDSITFPQRSRLTETHADGTSGPFYGYRISRKNR